MPENIAKLDDSPLFIKCDPLSRQFPREWRDIRFRRSSLPNDDGKASYSCPICLLNFDHTEIEFLQGDHIWPYSLFGETSWANYQLICGSCNARKRDFVDRSIRQILGAGKFREQVCDFLRQSVTEGTIEETDLVKLLLKRQTP